MEEDEYQQWWERVWSEREDALDAAFGRSHPPGSAEGNVLAFAGCGAGDFRMLIPGACAHVYPPVPDGGVGLIAPRADWLYATVGLSQPRGPEDEPWDDPARGPNLSGTGVEFALRVAEPCDWAPDLLRVLMGYHVGQTRLYPGHRIAGGFRALDTGVTSWFLGSPEPGLIEPADATRAWFLWPTLGAPRWFTTSTGNFELLGIVNITADEWAYARRTSGAHLQLLLCRAGVGQRCEVGRPSVLDDPATAADAARLAAVDEAEAMRLLQAFDPPPGGTRK